MNQIYFRFPAIEPGACIFTFCRNVENALYSRTEGTYTAWRYVNHVLTAEIHHLPADRPKITTMMADRFNAEVISSN